jgi:PAS domain S-box-containing protein
MFGWELPEVIGSILPVVPPFKREEHESILQQVFSGQTISAMETLRVDRAGNLLPVSLSVAPVRDDHRAFSGAIAVLENITERKRIETDLSETTAALSAVTHALNTLLDTGDWSAASQHLLSFALRQTASEFGFLGVVLDQSTLCVLAPDGTLRNISLEPPPTTSPIPPETQGPVSVHLDHLLAQVIAGRRTLIANSISLFAEGDGLPAGLPDMHSFLGVPIFKGKEVVGLIAIANRLGGYSGADFTSLETMARATGVLYDNYRQELNRRTLERQQEKLEAQIRQAQKMEVLGRLAGGVAHDFNNMLMVLGGCAELLDRSLPTESPARIYLDQIQRTTEKATAITKQLLAFSRKQVVEFRPIDLHEALTDSEFMLPRLLGSDVELTFRHEAKLCWILSDPTQLEQVVANLAINARDAMPNGGRLTISTRNAATLPEDAVDRADSPSTWVVLEVADTGAGMDEKTRGQIFEPFFTTKAHGKGTGLGLATVYGIVKQSRGHIQVESVLGRGTTFSLYFPAIVAPAPSPIPPKPSDIPEESGSGVTVLVADDEAALRQAVVQILRTTGYRVLEAENSYEAWEIARQHSGDLDVLLTDIVMPGLRGTELAKRVAKAHPEVQVIYMSGYAEGFQESPLPENSIFLQKPFRFATLLEQLKLVRRRS